MLVDFIKEMWTTVVYKISEFPQMGFTDFIDIIIVAYIFYMFLVWIRETRAWSLIKGILFIFLARQIFDALGLYTLAFSIESLFNVGLIAAIVLFQPEIRRALEQIGKGKFIITSAEDDYRRLNKEILDAIKKLADERTGALICIEKSIPLRDFMMTGIEIDSMISSQLLCNIFVDKTPLHDGAVILSKNRIAAAACILPVTAQEIGKELGTRHRAAVGLSEVSDCIAIVVSEETGKVSVASGGKLFRKLSIHEIENMMPNENSDEKSAFFSILRGLLK